ncbi:hypothetical protein RB213_006568 [Colletotrichum asianum]
MSLMIQGSQCASSPSIGRGHSNLVLHNSTNRQQQWPDEASTGDDAPHIAVKDRAPTTSRLCLANAFITVIVYIYILITTGSQPLCFYPLRNSAAVFLRNPTAVAKPPAKRMLNSAIKFLARRLFSWNQASLEVQSDIWSQKRRSTLLSSLKPPPQPCLPFDSIRLEWFGYIKCTGANEDYPFFYEASDFSEGEPVPGSSGGWRQLAPKRKQVYLWQCSDITRTGTTKHFMIDIIIKNGLLSSSHVSI